MARHHQLLRTLSASLLAATLVTASAQSRPTLGRETPEQRTAAAFDVAKKAGAPELYAFLKPMPKGADLHMHLSGAVYAETFIAEAIQQNLCIDTTILAFAPAPCTPPLVAASEVLKNQTLYDKLINSFSMRSFVPYAGFSGHDQFFSTFAKFGGLKDVGGQWLDEVASRAASQNEQYLEIMNTPSFSNAATLGYKLGWPQGAEQSVTPQQLADLRTALLALGLKNEVAIDIKEFADAKLARDGIEHCSAPITGHRNPACDVTIHWLYQVLRGFPPQQVFAQTLLGFEVASAAQSANPNTPDVVGLNFVMPEDGRISMQDYHLQMQMVDYLHTVYPNVRISLHAGELAPGMVPPDGLRFHIREAIDLGHAERIGHGIDALYEDNPAALLKEMAEKHIMVEINLTSNEGILGVKGTEHPLHAYMAAHVPWALSTDDEGVSRIDLTHEYVKGALEQNLTYADLKQSARTSLEHAFLAGESLYAHPDDFTHRKPACEAPITPTSQPALACSTLLQSSERAAHQYELEQRLATFESTQH